MEYEDTNILRTQYVDDLIEQRESMKEVMIKQGVEIEEDEGLDSMVEKVRGMEGMESLSYYNFSGCYSEELQEMLPSINFSIQDNLDNCFSKWNNADLSSVSTFNAKSMNNFVTSSVPSTNSITTYSVVLGKNFRLDNCTSLRGFLTNANTSYGYLLLDESQVPEQSTNNPIDLALFGYGIRIREDTNKNVVSSLFSLIKKLNFKSITSMESLFSNMNFGSGCEKEFEDFFNNVFYYLPTQDVEMADKFCYKTYCYSGTFKPLSSNVFPKITKLDTWFGEYSRMDVIDLSNWTFGNVTEIRNTVRNNNVRIVKMGHNPGTPLTSFYYACGSLPDLIELDFSGWDFGGLQAISMSGSGLGIKASTKLEVFKIGTNLGKGYKQKSANYSIMSVDLANSSKLSVTSVVDMFNKLYDLNITYGVYDEEGNPGTGKLYTQKVDLHADVIAQLTPEIISIITNKGWTLA